MCLFGLRERDGIRNRVQSRVLGHGYNSHPHAIRDAALYTSDLLNGKIGGPSVKPYMPPGIWKSISNASYKQDKGDKLYRRGIYTYWCRTVTPPTMMTFNAAARELVLLRNPLTSTPLQALPVQDN